jgi:hypothetical protein
MNNKNGPWGSFLLFLSPAKTIIKVNRRHNEKEFRVLAVKITNEVPLTVI